MLDSTGALQLDGVPRRLLGAQVTIVELMDQLIPGTDKDLVTPLAKRVTNQYENIYLKTKVTNVEARPEGLVVSFEGARAPATDTFDRILVAVGRRPNGQLIGAQTAGGAVDGGGFVPVDRQMPRCRSWCARTGSCW